MQPSQPSAKPRAASQSFDMIWFIGGNANVIQQLVVAMTQFYTQFHRSPVEVRVGLAHQVPAMVGTIPVVSDALLPSRYIWLSAPVNQD